MLRIMQVCVKFYLLDNIDLVNLEELYNQLENNYYELQKTLQSISSEKEYIANELDEQKKKSIALEVCRIL